MTEDAAPVPYELMRDGARSIRLRVETDGRVCVKAPRSVPKPLIDRFVSDRRGWIEKRRRVALLRPVRTYTDGERLPYLGAALTLRLEPGARSARLAGETLILPPGTSERTRERVEAWYRSSARAVYKERVAHYAALVGVEPGPLRVSGARTRWGSCGKDDSLNLSWRLLLAPDEILDYVVVHELCHIGQRDHSALFWARLARVMPDCRARRAWLKEHGGELEL